MSDARKPTRLEDVFLTSVSPFSVDAVKTGTWKYVEPIFEEKLPPCSHLCPTGNDISKALLAAARGDLEEAARLWRAGNPLPSTLGRVCPHFCEEECNRDRLGGKVAVHMIERFLGDYSLDTKYLPVKNPPTGKRVAVIGSGPAGLTAAYHLALRGHDVEVFDDKPAAGGYLRTGIPDYRLPKDILDKELSLIRSLGVRFNQEVHIDQDIPFEEIRQSFDAVIVAIGLHKNRSLGIQGEDHAGVLNGVKLLEDIILGRKIDVPERLLVVGGGNTAMDVARSLLRIGKKPTVVYRRTRAEMPAIESEVDHALEEGIPFHFLTAPSKVIIENDRVVGLECLKMELGEPDASGRRRPVAVEGSEFVIECDGIVTAIGEGTDLSLLPDQGKDDWKVATDRCLATPIEKVFAAGDAVDGKGTVTAAVGSGRRVASMVDLYLRGEGLPEEAPASNELWTREVNREEIVRYASLNPAYLQPQPRPEIEHLPAEERVSSFAEVVQGWTLEQAVAEARRCITCGTCNECGNCYYLCPDMAVQRRMDDYGYEIDFDHCKGCGICVEECPRGALTLREVAR